MGGKFWAARRSPSRNLEITRSCSPARKPPGKTGFGRGCSLRRLGKKYNGQTRVQLIVPHHTRVEKALPGGIPVERISEMKRVGPPMGLLRVGGAARRAGYAVELIDAAREGFEDEEEIMPAIGLRRYGLGEDELVRKIERFSPHIVGITAQYTHQWGNVRELAGLVKNIDPRIVVVLGGAHATGDYTNALLDSAADFVVMGEGERTFVELAAALEEGGTLNRVRGIAYRGLEGGRESIVLSPKRPFATNLDELEPDYGLIRLGPYSGPVHSGGRRKRGRGLLTYVFTSTGCNQGCGLCAIPFTNGPFRHLSEGGLEKQLGSLVKRGVSEVLVEDDNWLHDPSWALKTCSMFSKYNLAWMQEGGLALNKLIALHLGEDAGKVLGNEYYTAPYRHVRKAIGQGISARQIVRAMAESGCYSVYLAIESANRASMEVLGKSTAYALQDYALEIVRMFEGSGIRVTGGFMLGLGGPAKGGAYFEGIEEIRRDMEYAMKLMHPDAGHGMSYANPFIVTPLPGTPLGEYLMQFASRDYDTGFSHELGSSDPPGSLSADELEVERWNMLCLNGREKVEAIIRTGSWPV